jgi:hypothetical chaperone protein
VRSELAMSRAVGIGLDFGTTNSALAWTDADGGTHLVRFTARAGPLETFRSVLYFDRGEDGEEALSTRSGAAAIERYLDSEEKNGRLIQSLKSFLASRRFHSTSIFGRAWRLEDLVALILGSVREEAEAALSAPIRHVVVGRPVRFVRAADEDDEELALRRLTASLRNAGFANVSFEYEPVGAAYHYESRLEQDELVLIADFGGGTSDFSLLRVGPGRGDPDARRGSILGHAGVPVAGDAFDGKLVRHLVAPRLGRGAEFRSVFDRVLPVPTWIYSQLERWHHVSFLKSKRTLEILLDLRREALEPEKLEALLKIVEGDLGYLLFRAIERTKRELSDRPETRFRLEHEDLAIEAHVTRSAFEGWIAEETAAMARAVDDLLARARVAAREVDRVFLTGGSSFVPAVRQIFEDRFGSGRMRFGDEFTSVANGLALRARESAAAAGGC